MITLTSATERKAKKQHCCGFCGSKINIGDRYMRSSHVNDGDFFEWKSHIVCNTLYEALQMDSEDGVDTDYFHTEIREKYLSITAAYFPELSTETKWSKIFNFICNQYGYKCPIEP